jgi:hypothetical protein
MWIMMSRGDWRVKEWWRHARGITRIVRLNVRQSADKQETKMERKENHRKRSFLVYIIMPGDFIVEILMCTCVNSQHGSSGGGSGWGRKKQIQCTVATQKWSNVKQNVYVND